MYPHIITISCAHVPNTEDPQGNKQYIYTLPNIASHLTSTIKQTVQTPTIAWWPDPPAHLHFPLYISTYPLHSTAYPPSHTPYPPASTSTSTSTSQARPQPSDSSSPLASHLACIKGGAVHRNLTSGSRGLDTLGTGLVHALHKYGLGMWREM